MSVEPLQVGAGVCGACNQKIWLNGTSEPMCSGCDASTKDCKCAEPKFLLWTNKDSNPDTLFVKIDLKSPTEDVSAAIYMLGFFEHAKNQAIAMVQAKRAMKKKTGIITPGNHSSLKVH